jgi:hypothetical protein
MTSDVAGLIATVIVVTYNLRVGMAALRGSRNGPFI